MFTLFTGSIKGFVHKFASLHPVNGPVFSFFFFLWDMISVQMSISDDERKRQERTKMIGRIGLKKHFSGKWKIGLFCFVLFFFVLFFFFGCTVPQVFHLKCLATSQMIIQKKETKRERDWHCTITHPTLSCAGATTFWYQFSVFQLKNWLSFIRTVFEV